MATDNAKSVTVREPQLLVRLNQLAKTGFFGKTATEVAEGLLRVKLRELKAEGWFNKEAGSG